jgi:CelD/BcsL family acetyltransferase involved in cellulose biosynthesis
VCAAARSRLVALSEADRGAWAALAERALEPNPFFHPDFVVPAAALTGAPVALVVVGDWEAAVPVVAARRWRRLPLPGLLSWIHDQCFLGTPLVADVEAVAPLLAGLRSLGSGIFAELDLAAADGPVGAALDAALPTGALGFGAFSRAALVRREESTYLEGRLSGKHRRAHRRLGRDLAEHLDGELRLVDHAGSADAVDRFLALEAAGWKGEQGTALASLDGGAAFTHAVCSAFAARGALQLLFLEVGERVVAARLNLRGGGELFCVKIAHDESLRKFSPGMQMELAMIDHFHADPTAMRMDSCTDPGSEMFNRLWADRKHLRGALLPRGTAGRAARPALRAVAERISANRVPE